MWPNKRTSSCAGVAGALSDENDDNTNDGYDSDDDGGVEHKDCIGAGKPAPLQPLAGVLAKLELRKQQIIARCCHQPTRPMQQAGSHSAQCSGAWRLSTFLTLAPPQHLEGVQ